MFAYANNVYCFVHSLPSLVYQLMILYLPGYIDMHLQLILHRQLVTGQYSHTVYLMHILSWRFWVLNTNKITVKCLISLWNLIQSSKNWKTFQTSNVWHRNCILVDKYYEYYDPVILHCTIRLGTMEHVQDYTFT